MGSIARKRMDVESFLNWQGRQDERYELVLGQPVAMTGASRRHDCIVVNTIAEISTQLRGKPCRAATLDLALVLPTGNVRRPDIQIDCGAHVNSERIIEAATGAIEVLSASTEFVDQVLKLADYRSLSSIRAYLMLFQDRPRAILCTRAITGDWILSDVEGLEGRIELPDVAVTLAMADLYEGVGFEEA